MSSTKFIYPATPRNVPSHITEPGTAFKKEVAGTMGSIIFFFIVYILLFLLSIALIAGCVYGGFLIIITIPRMITILIGAGLIGLGIMVFVFLVKFMFAVSKFDNSGSIEITEKDQPKLFAFIRQLTKDTHTPFPKKIYLSPEVNACVFYNSSFWSMFFPVRKNLQIGLGLVNILSVSEFKAVMAHEFGHFSQRSMKLGSFVYNVNKVIFNMLFDNNSYQNMLQGFANVHGTFAFFAMVTARIAEGIQWVLRKVYGVINKSYMRLSREMEFHADAVAASVSGSESLVTALRKLEIGNSGYNITLQKCNELLKEKKISENVYQNQRIIVKQIANEYKLDIKNEMPVITRSFIDNNNFSRINYKDQWASHPSTDDRQHHLDNLDVKAEIIDDTSWVLFDNSTQIQADMTRKIYERVKEKQTTTINEKEFEDQYSADIQRYVLPDAYNGYFSGRQISILEKDQLETNGEASSKTFSELFSPENATRFKKIQALETDIEILKAIANRNITTKTFDLDGKKHSWKQAAELAEKLEGEKTADRDKLNETDKTAIHFFLANAKKIGREDELKNMYQEYFSQRKEADEYLGEINIMLRGLSPIYSGQTIPIHEINTMIGTLKNSHEIRFKGWLKKWRKLDFIPDSHPLAQKIDNYLSKEYAYFGGRIFLETELADLDSICRESWDQITNFLFDRFKRILQTQLEFSKN
jgi:Zn-dependent protease with chaperone function